MPPPIRFEKCLAKIGVKPAIFGSTGSSVTVVGRRGHAPALQTDLPNGATNYNLSIGPNGNGDITFPQIIQHFDTEDNGVRSLRGLTLIAGKPSILNHRREKKADRFAVTLREQKLKLYLRHQRSEPSCAGSKGSAQPTFTVPSGSRIVTGSLFGNDTTDWQ